MLRNITFKLLKTKDEADVSSKEPTCQGRRHRRRGFNPWVMKIPWRRARQLTLVFLPGKSHGKRNLAGYSPWGCKESDMTEQSIAKDEEKILNAAQRGEDIMYIRIKLEMSHPSQSQ